MPDEQNTADSPSVKRPAAQLPNEQLKPCPFCGSTESLYVYHDDSSDHRKHWTFSVICDECRAQSGELEDRDAAVVRWNSRAQSPELQRAYILIGMIAMLPGGNDMIRRAHAENEAVDAREAAERTAQGGPDA